jgi:hypothetical protein
MVIVILAVIIYILKELTMIIHRRFDRLGKFMYDFVENNTRQDFNILDTNNDPPLIHVFNNAAGTTTFFFEDCDKSLCFSLSPGLLIKLKEELDGTIKDRKIVIESKNESL